MRVIDTMHRRLGWATSLLLCLFAVQACDADAQHEMPSSSSTVKANRGPLRVSEGSSGSMALAPIKGRSNASAVFGGLLLCTQGPAVRLTRVRYYPSATAFQVRPLLREVPPAASRVPRDSIYWAPVSAWRGLLSNPRVRKRIPGRVTLVTADTTVGQACGPPDPAGPRVELLTELRAGARGAEIESLRVDYEVDGDRYSVAVPWTYVLCGRQGNFGEHCSN